MTAILKRSPYQGVRQILRFNWPKYLVSTVCISAASFARPFFPKLNRPFLFVVILPAVYWTCSSLLASHYIYDRSHLYDFSWLPGLLKICPSRWLNVHCGLDETSAPIAAAFRGGSGEVIDIFDPRAMTENSIRKARAARHNATLSTPARFYELPFPDKAFDAVFCIFAAHELRHHADRVRLFTEIARLLTPRGTFLLVEHLRDGPNFLAFGPGFLHFHSWHSWLQAAQDANLVCRTEFPFTPFVRVATFGRRI